MLKQLVGKLKQKNSTCLLKSTIKAKKCLLSFRGKIRVIDNQTLIASLNVSENTGL